MPTARTLRRTACLAPALLALGMTGSASAKSQTRDRDHDRMPDRWEQQYKLNTHRNDARRDADHDGLSNLAEYRNHTNPRKRDTDGDGIGDRNDVLGTVVSFTDGVLTITAADGREISAKVTDATELECKAAPAATTRSRGDDDGEGHDSGDDHGHGGHGSDDAPATTPAPPTTLPGDGSTTVPAPGTTIPGGHGGDDHGDDDEDAACGTEVLVPGAKLVEAELDLTASGAVWHELKVQPAAVIQTTTRSA